MLKTKITTIGRSPGIILPEEILAKLKLQKGDTLCFVETDKGYEIKSYDSAFEEEMDAARKIMKRYHNALSELAK